MKLRKILSAALAVLMTASAVSFTYASAETVVVYEKDFVSAFEKNAQINNNAAKKAKADVDGRECIQLTPTPNEATPGKDANFNFFAGALVRMTGAELASVSKITIDYKFDVPEGVTSNVAPMQIVLLSNGGALSSNVTANASEVVKGEWATATFDVASQIASKATGTGELVQVWLRPFGPSPSVLAQNLSDYEVMYLENIRFISDGGEVAVTPSPKPESGTAAPSVGGSQATAPSDADVVYSARFYDTVKAAKNVQVNNGAATVKAVNIDGIDCAMLTPTPSEATAGKDANFNFFGGGLIKIPGDVMKTVSKISIRYKYDLPSGMKGNTAPMQIVLLSNGGALSSNVTANASATVAGEWTEAVFDVEASVARLSTGSGEVVQMWLRPYGPSPEVLAQNLGEYEVMYLDEIKFYGGNKGNVSVPEEPKVTEKPADGALSETSDILTSEDFIAPVFTVDYPSKVAKIYDNTGILNKSASVDGITCLSITPTPSAATPGKKMNLDVYNLGIKGEDMKGIRFIGIPYKYVVPQGVEPVATSMQLNTLSGHAKQHTSFTRPVVNMWSEAIFDVRVVAELFAESGNVLNQVHFYPYGNALGTKMDKGEIMYIGKFKFYDAYPIKDASFSLAFITEHPGAVGNGIEDAKKKPGESIVLPESPWSVDGGRFLGWKSSVDDKLYAPGDTVLMNEGDMHFTAEFVEESPDYKLLKFQNYQNGTVNGLKYCKEVTNVDFEGMAAVKVVPNNEYENKTSTITVEGFSYANAKVSLSEYKYAAFTYYAIDPGKKPTRFKMNFMTNGGALSKQYKKEAVEELTYGEWAIATFDFTDVSEYLNPEKPNEYIRQIHVKPFGEISIPEFTGNEVIYINQLMFFKEKPELSMHTSYMKGYDGGLFKPSGNMTRAEACTIIARLAAGGDANVPANLTSAFTDVASDAWYHKYVAYVESLGFLKSYSGTFLPDKAITRAEFVELVFNMGLLRDSGKNGVFTDVDASHERYSVITAAGKAGLVNGYAEADGTFTFKPDNTISRAEVVKVINNAYKRSITKDAISHDITYCFADVEDSHWAYAEICEAALTHVQNGDKWVCSMTSPAAFYISSVDTAAGAAFVAELDKRSEARKAELRATSTPERSVTGTSYYVSADGDDSADGKSPETAWKTIAKVDSVKFKVGDAVYFRRGDIFRGQFRTSGGVLYSAYGNGEKPRIYGSPENGTGEDNWTLLEGTNNIWVYKKQLKDVGAIVLNGGEKVAWKIAPNFKDGKYFTSNEGDFDVKVGLTEDLSFFSHIVSGKPAEEGTLYFRCDKGNPGVLYSDIEFNVNGNLIGIGGTDVTIDNLCLMYTGTHGIGAGTTKNLTVTNCEVAYIGGTVQTYSFKGTTSGAATRLGNGVEIYGSADGYTVDNCYIHHCFDAGITHQYHGQQSNSMYNIKYTNNLIEDCAYSIEYFNSDTNPNPGTVYDGHDYLIANNIMRRAGNSFGRRFGNSASTHLKGWTSENKYDPGTYIIENNIFDRACGYLIQTPAKYREWLPIYRGNTFVQDLGGNLGYYDADLMYYDTAVALTIKSVLGDKSATVYFVEEY